MGLPQMGQFFHASLPSTLAVLALPFQTVFNGLLKNIIPCAIRGALAKSRKAESFITYPLSRFTSSTCVDGLQAATGQTDCHPTQDAATPIHQSGLL